LNRASEIAGGAAPLRRMSRMQMEGQNLKRNEKEAHRSETRDNATCKVGACPAHGEQYAVA